MDGVQSEQDLQDAIALKVFDDDESALTDILTHYGPRIERSLLERFRGLLTAEDIEEVFCDALQKFWAARARYDDKKGSVRAMLYMIALRRAMDVLQYGWRKAQQMEIGVDKEFLENELVDTRHLGTIPQDDPPPNDSEKDKRKKAVQDTLAELPDIQRQILEQDATAEGDVDAAELGRRLGGIPAGTIRVYRIRARDAFRAGMAKRGYKVQPVEHEDAKEVS